MLTEQYGDDPVSRQALEAHDSWTCGALVHDVRAKPEFQGFLRRVDFTTLCLSLLLVSPFWTAQRSAIRQTDIGKALEYPRSVQDATVLMAKVVHLLGPPHVASLLPVGRPGAPFVASGSVLIWGVLRLGAIGPSFDPR